MQTRDRLASDDVRKGRLWAGAGDLEHAEGLKDIAVFSNYAPLAITPDAAQVRDSLAKPARLVLCNAPHR